MLLFKANFHNIQVFPYIIICIILMLAILIILKTLKNNNFKLNLLLFQSLL